MEQIRVSSYQLVVTVMCLVCLGFSVGMSSESDPLIKTYVSSSLPSNDGLVSSVPKLTESEWDSLVIQSKLPVMVMFIARWCIPCRAIAPVLEKLDSEFKDKFKFYTVDTDEEEGLTRLLDIRALPTTFVFKGGNIMGSYKGSDPRIIRMLVQDYM